MTKSESKYFNTALIIDKAFIELLSIKDVQYITIKEICEKAGVNRSTFYLHYENINDLLEETIDYINNDFRHSFELDGDGFVNRIEELPLEDLILIKREYLIPYLEYVKGHKNVYRAAVNNSVIMRSEQKMSSLYMRVLKPIFIRFGIPENEQKYWMKFYINGVMAIVFEWLKNDCKESVEEIFSIIEKCIGRKQLYEGHGSGDT
ncbi:MAG: TetR/AcrR family transcriptional regulator [Butyrivibrio sp.]|uniref:TetR/AcrR family transcriptional regulator n=1 Tax=Butyrivibrio sp. TaxID=28121 RepID=UPI0025E1F10A|nr:TetR/AcrR family transcriptional regulator [Butyrivibrio sp.]MCR5771952.1 TetR/AcrR family transcriptional regulator [Butyrivibrio sp.]